MVEVFKKAYTLRPSENEAQVRLSPDGAWIANATGQEVFVHDAATGDVLHNMKFDSKVEGITWSNTGKSILVSSDGTLTEFSHTLGGWDRRVVQDDSSPLFTCFTNADGLVACCSEPSGARIFDPSRDYALIQTIIMEIGQVTTLGFSYSGDLLAIGCERKFSVYGRSGPGEMFRELIEKEFPGIVWTLCFTPNDSHLIVGGGGGTASVLTIPPSPLNADTRLSFPVRSLKLKSNNMSYFCVSHDGRRLIATSLDGFVRVINLSDGAELAKLSASGGVTSLSFHPGSGRLAAGSFHGSIDLWNAEALASEYKNARSRLASANEVLELGRESTNKRIKS